MKQKQVPSRLFEKFSASFRWHVHFLVAQGHNNIRSQMQTVDEEEITGLIFEAIREILRSGHQRWYSKYSVHNESPISSGQRRGKDRRRTDLFIEYVTEAGHPEYVFEAKPLNYPKIHQRTNYYTGEKGMMRFLRGEYANYTANYPEVGMIGYVLSDTPEQWYERLKIAIDRNKSALRLLKPQEDVKIIDALPVEWLSEHQRDSTDRPIVIYHLLLDCCAEQ